MSAPPPPPARQATRAPASTTSSSSNSNSSTSTTTSTTTCKPDEFTMPRAIKGVLVECDPSIKAIILKIDEDFHHAFIIEDLDDTTLVIKEAKLAELKERLEKILEKTQMMEKEEESDPEQPG